MIPSFGRVPGGRISDWGFWTVVIVAVLAGATIIMGMKLVFEEEAQSQIPEHTPNAIVQVTGNLR